MRRTIAATAAVLLLAGCAGSTEPDDDDPIETTSPPASTQPPTTEPPDEPEATTATGPSREGLIKAMADSWGAMTDAEKSQMCDDLELAGYEYMWEALDRPASISATEVEMIWRDYCRDY